MLLLYRLQEYLASLGNEIYELPAFPDQLLGKTFTEAAQQLYSCQERVLLLGLGVDDGSGHRDCELLPLSRVGVRCMHALEQRRACETLRGLLGLLGHTSPCTGSGLPGCVCCWHWSTVYVLLQGCWCWSWCASWAVACQTICLPLPCRPLSAA